VILQLELFYDTFLFIMNAPKTLDDCFEELCSNRGWWSKSPYDRKAASKHRKLFLLGKLPDETKRMYLKCSGYYLSQPELWQLDNII
jgi:hypothetical protein